jgi:hypothetical protein
MLLEEAFETANIELEEGIVFFKNSKKMKKLAGTILQKSQFIEDDNEKKQIISLVNKINKLADKFESLEQMYKTRRLIGKTPQEIKQQYKTLETEYADLVAIAKKEQTKTILKNINAYAIMVASMIIPTILIGKLSKQFGSINPITHNKELNPFLRAGVYMTTAGVVRSLSPAHRIENVNKDIVNRSSSALQNKEIL